VKSAERRSLEDIESAVWHVVTIIVMCVGAIIAVIYVVAGIVMICMAFSLFR
jgi:nitrogen fixation protein FixH